jgi:hypothetical protein
VEQGATAGFQRQKIFQDAGGVVMPDIGFADKPKRLVRLGLWWIRKKFAEGKEAPEIREDVLNCGNPVIRHLHELMIETSDNIEENYQNALMRDLTEFMLWIIYKDTAYRDPFFWTLKRILDKKDELMPLIEKYYKEPEKWYINAWTESKKNTARLREENKLSENQLGPDENIFVPDAQWKKIYGIIDEETKKEKRKRGWI